MFDLGEILGILLTILWYGVVGIITVALVGIIIGAGFGIVFKVFALVVGI